MVSDNPKRTTVCSRLLLLQCRLGCFCWGCGWTERYFIIGEHFNVFSWWLCYRYATVVGPNFWLYLFDEYCSNRVLCSLEYAGIKIISWHRRTRHGYFFYQFVHILEENNFTAGPCCQRNDFPIIFFGKNPDVWVPCRKFYKHKKIAENCKI